MKLTPLKKSFYHRDAESVAHDLLGKLLISEIDNTRTGGLIVETEAYLPVGDTACHGAFKKTAKNSVMFDKPGLIYVYSIHAKWCFNIVTAPEGQASAVLVRAIEPTIGLETMQQRRGTQDLVNLCRGPARLCQALNIDKSLNGMLLSKSNRLCVYQKNEESDLTVAKTVRIGVTSAHELALRYIVRDNRFVSEPKKLNQ